MGASGIDLYRLAGSSVTAELAVRLADGARFKRYQDNTPRGYRWRAWQSTTELPSYTSNGHDPAAWSETGSGWVLHKRNATVRLPRVDEPVVLSGWVGVAFYRCVGCDGTVEARVRPNDLAGVEIRAEVDLYGAEDVSLSGSFPARHTARLRAIGREALRQLLEDLGPDTCAVLASLREERRAAGPEWQAPPDHIPCSLVDFSRHRIVVPPPAQAPVAAATSAPAAQRRAVVEASALVDAIARRHGAVVAFGSYDTTDEHGPATLHYVALDRQPNRWRETWRLACADAATREEAMASLAADLYTGDAASPCAACGRECGAFVATAPRAFDTRTEQGGRVVGPRTVLCTVCLNGSIAVEDMDR